MAECQKEGELLRRWGFQGTVEGVIRGRATRSLSLSLAVLRRGVGPARDRMWFGQELPHRPSLPWGQSTETGRAPRSSKCCPQNLPGGSRYVGAAGPGLEPGLVHHGRGRSVCWATDALWEPARGWSTRALLCSEQHLSTRSHPVQTGAESIP